MKAWGILLIVFLFCGCTKLNPLTATISSIPAPERFEPFKLNFSEPPEFNKPVELTMNVVGGGFPFPNATIKIYLPDGFELVSGDLEWQGDLTKDVPVQLKAVVKTVKTGEWVIEAQIIDSGEGKRVRTALYVSVSEDSVEVSETTPPGFDAEPSGFTPPSAPATRGGRVSVGIGNSACLGSASAPVTIIEFGNYRCIYCQRFWAQILPQIKTEYIETGKVRFIYRNFLPTKDANAQRAAESVECAGDQGMFWEMHDKIFETQNEWSNIDNPEVIFKGYAAELELHEDDFAKCLDTGRYIEKLKEGEEDAVAAGVTGTPTFFINGIFVVGAQPFSTFKQMIDVELEEDGSVSTIYGECRGF